MQMVLFSDSKLVYRKRLFALWLR